MDQIINFFSNNQKYLTNYNQDIFVNFKTIFNFTIDVESENKLKF